MFRVWGCDEDTGFVVCIGLRMLGEAHEKKLYTAQDHELGRI